jgi:WD40 repeat protein
MKGACVVRGLRTCLLLAGVAALSLSAATTTTWELNSWQDLVRGRFDGVALDRDGRLTLAPEMTPVFTSGQPAIWSVAQAPDGSVYAGTGNRGRVYRIAPDGTSSVVWSADQPEVFAVAVAPDGHVYAASSPDGKLVRLDHDKAIDVFAPKAKYIWAVAVGPDGSLFVGTGGPGNVYRVDPSGASELWYETGQEHVTSLAFDNQGRLLAGTEPNGIIYRIGAKGKAFALYSAGLPEIRTIVAAADGTIYAAAMGGSIAARGVSQMPISIASGIGGAAASATSVTVTDSSSAQAGPDVKMAAKQAAPQQAVQQVLPSLPVVETPGVDKSAVYRINPDNTVETIWSSKEENIYDLVVRPDDSLLVTTDAQGRIYRLLKNGKAALIAQTGEGEGTRLLATPAGLLAATAETGRLFRLTDQKKASGVYESPVHDAGAVARWGRIACRDGGHPGDVTFETRTGNSARPDNTWSDWQPLRAASGIQRVQSPNARYIQWRATLGGEATLENISVSYLPQNSPPVNRSILVTTLAGGQSSAQKAAAASTSTNASFSVTVTDTGDAAPQTSQGTPTQTLSRAGNSQIQISWQADDPDGDRLVYSIWFRGEDETDWKLLRANIFENTLLLDNDAFADGRYLFRVLASDRPSNGPDSAREAELVSSPVLIDNTPPMVAVTGGRRSGNEADIDVDASDAASSLRRCEYSVDAGPWLPVEAVDGITDTPRAQFHIHVLHLSPGEHLVAIRVYDSAGNAGLAKWVAR